MSSCACIIWHELNQRIPLQLAGVGKPKPRSGCQIYFVDHGAPLQNRFGTKNPSRRTDPRKIVQVSVSSSFLRMDAWVRTHETNTLKHRTEHRTPNSLVYRRASGGPSHTFLTCRQRGVLLAVLLHQRAAQVVKLIHKVALPAVCRSCPWFQRWQLRCHKSWMRRSVSVSRNRSTGHSAGNSLNPCKTWTLLGAPGIATRSKDATRGSLTDALNGISSGSPCGRMSRMTHVA